MFPKESLVVLSLALSVAGAGGACGGPRYAYAPVSTTGAELGGRAAADYPFPPQSPHGRVRLATFGVAQLVPQGPRYFHVRMLVSNQGAVSWTVDKAEQVLDITLGDDRAHKAQVRAATDLPTDSSPPRTAIGPGAERAVDLFFPLSPEEAADVPALEVIWTIKEGERGIVTTTPFERFLASGAARSVPRPEPFPYGSGGVRTRMPGTPDGNWPQSEQIPRFDPLPGVTPR
jgi:hypothetical protein